MTRLNATTSGESLTGELEAQPAATWSLNLEDTHAALHWGRDQFDERRRRGRLRVGRSIHHRFQFVRVQVQRPGCPRHTVLASSGDGGPP